MDLGRDDWIGMRVGKWRTVAGLRQEDLAARVGVSREYISMIENGHKPVTKRALLISLAEALGVSVTDLIDQPATPQNSMELEIHGAVPGIRRALEGPDEEPRPRHVSAVAADIDRAMAARMACDYATLAALLGPLLAETQALSEDARTADQAAPLLVQTCVTASLALKPLGYVDLALRLAERAQAVATRHGDPVGLAAADFTRAQGRLAQGVRERSLTLASAGADRVQGATGDAARTWYGMLHLHAAMSAATLGRSDEATAHFDEAASVVHAVQGDPWRMEFTPSNVGVWRVGIALENGDVDQAPVHARKVDQSKLRTVQRRAHLHIHTGRALYQAGRKDEAVRSFLYADQVSAHEVRSRPTVKEIVGQMLRDARREAGSDQLRDLAVRVGVDPLAPVER